MKRVVALVSVAVLLVLGVAVNNFGGDDPVVSSDGEAPAVAGDLPTLGPVDLIATAYTATVEANCSQSNPDCKINNLGPEINGFVIDSNVTPTCSPAGPCSFTVLTECSIDGNDRLDFEADVSPNPCGTPTTHFATITFSANANGVCTCVG